MKKHLLLFATLQMRLGGYDASGEESACVTFDQARDNALCWGCCRQMSISQFGNTFSLVAIPWFVLETTGSASQTGISVATGVVPLVVVGMVSGPIIERVGYKRSSIVSDLLSSVSALLIPVLYLTRGLVVLATLAAGVHRRLFR